MKKLKAKNCNFIDLTDPQVANCSLAELDVYRADTGNLLRSNVSNLCGELSPIAVSKTPMNLGLALGLVFLAGGEIGETKFTKFIKIKNYGNLTKKEKKWIRKAFKYSNYYAYYKFILKILGLYQGDIVGKPIVPLLASKKK